MWFADNGWDESTLTWNSKPAIGADLLGEIRAPEPDKSYDFALDESKLQDLLGSPRTLAITNKDRSVSDDLWLQSSNFEVEARRPYLTLTFR